MKVKHFLKTSLVFILIYIFAVFSMPVVAAGTTAVSVDSAAIVSPGQEFTVRISVDDIDDFDACNYDITYDPTVVQVSENAGAPIVTNGDIDGKAIPVSQKGFIPTGTQGKVRVVQNVEGIGGVSGSGYLAEIHFHAVGAAGTTSDISLQNGLLGDKDAQEIPATWAGSTVQVSAGGGGGGIVGGGGGGGGSAVGDKRFTNLMSVTDQDLRLLDDVEALSVDIKFRLFIEKDTVVKNKFDSILTSILVETLENPPGQSLKAEIIGSAYDASPSGAKFEPPALLALKYDEEWLPEGVSEENLHIAVWNGANQEWEKIEGTVYPDDNIIIAYLNHLSTYAIIAGTRPAELGLSELTINSAEVDAGEDITVSVIVTNTGDLAGSFEVQFKIDNMVKSTQRVNLKGRASRTVGFSVDSGSAGEHTVTVTNLSKTYVARESSTAPPPLPEPETPPTPAPEPVSALPASVEETAPGETEPAVYTLTISMEPAEGGSVTPEPGKYISEAGKELSLTAIEGDGWRFVEWRGDVSSQDNTVVVQMDANKVISAIFQKIETSAVGWPVIGGFVLAGVAVLVAPLLIIHARKNRY